MDHFARLGLPAALDLEPGALDRAYFALQRRWHPDRFANLDLPHEMKDYAAAMLARINIAHDQLASATPR